MVSCGSLVVFAFSVCLWVYSLRLATKHKCEPTPRSLTPGRQVVELPQRVLRPDGSFANIPQVSSRSLFLLASNAVGVVHPASGSQYFQDEAVFKLVFDNTGPLEKRRFVEFGASDGFYNSNTLFFERAWDWSGLLLEGDPDLVIQARTVRRAPVLNKVVCSSSKDVVFARFAQMGLSGIMTEDTIKERIAARKAKGERAELLSKTSVRCEPLASILLEQGWKKTDPIDFLSIDVEGAELDIVKSFKWDEWRVKVVLVEVDKPGVAFQMREFFRGLGMYRNPYRIDHFHPDDIYVLKTVAVNDLNAFEVACEERCRRITQCKRWKENETFCET